MKCKVLHLDQSNLRYEYRLGKECTENSSEEKDLGVLVVDELDVRQYCMLASESQLYLRLHQKKCIQQVEGSDPADLLRVGEI